MGPGDLFRACGAKLLLSPALPAFNRDMAIRGSTTTFAAAACVAAMAALAPFSCSSACAQAPADEKTLKETELRGVEDTLKASEDERRKIEADVEAIKLDRVRLNAALIETTAKVQETEAERAEASQRLDALAAEAVALGRSLEARRDALADALGALERMGEIRRRQFSSSPTTWPRRCARRSFSARWCPRCRRRRRRRRAISTISSS